jgi:hypothetical protein
VPLFEPHGDAVPALKEMVFAFVGQVVGAGSGKRLKKVILTVCFEKVTR